MTIANMDFFASHLVACRGSVAAAAGNSGNSTPAEPVAVVKWKMNCVLLPPWSVAELVDRFTKGSDRKAITKEESLGPAPLELPPSFSTPKP